MEVPQRGEVRTREGESSGPHKAFKMRFPWKAIKAVQKRAQREEETERGQRGQTLPESDPGLSLAPALQQQASTLHRETGVNMTG